MPTPQRLGLLAENALRSPETSENMSANFLSIAPAKVPGVGLEGRLHALIVTGQLHCDQDQGGKGRGEQCPGACRYR